MLESSKKHLKEAGKAYGPHGLFAVKAGVLLVYAGLASIIHGLIPALFPFKSRDIVRDLAEKSRGDGNN
jgi:uncharacterized protein YjeT (DUF2065 family)